MSRILIFVLTLLALAPLGAAAHGQADPAGDRDPRLAGYPELAIRLTADRIEAPARVAAGRTLLIEENAEAAPGHAFVLRVPDDVLDADVAAALAPGAPPMGESTPEWFWRAIFVGNPDRAAPDGGRAFALVDLAPGRYVVGNPYRPASEFARFEVVANDLAAPAPADDPAADVAVAMREMAFDLPAAVPDGRSLWRVDNAGAVFHELAILPVPAGATVEQVQAALGTALTAEAAGGVFEEQTAPAELGPAWTDWRPNLVAGVGVASPGQLVWAQIDLAPGRYAAVCFIPSGDGRRHLTEGMVRLFTAGDGAAATAGTAAASAPDPSHGHVG